MSGSEEMGYQDLPPEAIAMVKAMDMILGKPKTKHPMTNVRSWMTEKGAEVVHASWGRYLEDACKRRDDLLKEALQEVPDDLAKRIQLELDEGI